MSKGKLVVGVDGSATATQALMWAAHEASSRHLTLEVAYSEADDNARPGDGSPRAMDFARTLVLDAESAVYDSEATCGVCTIVGAEPAAELLVRLSKEAEMVVVGSHGLGRFASAVLGSVAFDVAAQAHCPVVIVPGDWSRHRANADATILVGVSTSGVGLSALRFAFAEADRRGEPLLALRSWSKNDVSLTPRDANPPTAEDSAALRSDYVEEVLRPYREMHPEVDVRIHHTELPADVALLKAADHSSLFVLGRGSAIEHRTRLTHHTSYLAHHAPCPVVIAGTRVSAASELLGDQAARTRATAS
jgi:nucleotide-binding universal stress UspA family protein